MKVLIINGSPRRNGNSDQIESFVAKLLKEKGTDVQILKLRGLKMTMPDHCQNCALGLPCKNIKDDFDKKIIPQVTAFNHWLIITPTICGFTSALTKIFIDRLAPLYNEGKLDFFRELHLGLIIHGQAKDSWGVVVDWFKDFQHWSTIKCFDYAAFLSTAEKGKVKIPGTKVSALINKILKNEKVRSL